MHARFFAAVAAISATLATLPARAQPAPSSAPEPPSTPATPAAPETAPAPTPAPAEAPAPVTPTSELPHAVADDPPGPAVQETVAPAPSPLHWKVTLTERAAAASTSRISVLPVEPGESSSVSGPGLLENRLRLHAKADWHLGSRALYQVEAQLEGEHLWRDEALDATLPPDEAPSLRKAWVEAITGVGMLAGGRTVATWGLGLLAASPEADPMQFGMRGTGAVVDRVQYALLPAAIVQGGDPTKAFPLAIALAYDRVVRDDLHHTPDGQASNLVAALLYRGTTLQAGAYAVQREQRDGADLGLDVRSYDAFAAWQGAAGPWKLRAAGEGVLVQGTSTWLRSATMDGPLDVQQYGAVLRLEAERRWLTFRLEGGLASGDDRPLDSTLKSFRFASDYRVGLVLFPQVQRVLSERTMRQLGNPLHVAQPPLGVDRVQTEGAVTQAMYLNPVLRVQAHRHFAVLLGAVLAQTPVDTADPFQTYLAGGTPTGPLGAKQKRDLGLELDGAVEGRLPLGKYLDLTARVDAGVLLPGGALSDMAAVGVVQAQGLLRATF